MTDFVGLLLTGAGSSAVLLGLGGWLGKVWSARIAEAEKARYAREIELLKSELAVMQAQRQRVSDAKFELYTDLWNRLQDLKSIVDRLWERADVETIHNLGLALEGARFALNRGRLILDARHYRGLAQVLSLLSQYEVGKKRLIEIRSQQELVDQFHNDSEHRLTAQIRANQHIKNQYEALLDEIVEGFRRDLGLAA